MKRPGVRIPLPPPLRKRPQVAAPTNSWWRTTLWGPSVALRHNVRINPYKHMKIATYLVTGTCIAALTLLVPINASAQGKKSKESASPAASPKAAATTTATTDKPARAVPLRGTATAVDKSAKTFTIAGKTSSRVFKATDATTITKAGAAATFADLSENEYVTGSYLKGADGTLELKSLKIGGKTDAEKAGSTKKKSKKDDAATEDGTAEE